MRRLLALLSLAVIVLLLVGFGKINSSSAEGAAWVVIALIGIILILTDSPYSRSKP